MRSFCLPLRQPLIELNARLFEPKLTRRHDNDLFEFLSCLGPMGIVRYWVNNTECATAKKRKSF